MIAPRDFRNVTRRDAARTRFLLPPVGDSMNHAASVSDRLLFEKSRPGRGTIVAPPVEDSRPLTDLIPAEFLADAPPDLPELAELDVVRHYTELSSRNMAIDANFYPLGSCTMKYNPRRNERLAGLPGLLDLHPYQDESTIQGMLRLLDEVQGFLGEIAGLPAVSLHPAAGAQGELTALMVAAAYFRDRGETKRRRKVLVPDSAHGTNPASAHLAGFETVTVKSDHRGLVDLADFHAKLDDHAAVFMITNPNTVGLFDPQIVEIAQALHDRGALLYLDGANMNAILGQVRPGDMGVDLMHYNPHKTFSGPHGGGGPGAGPIAVRDFLAPYLPVPRVGRDEQGGYRLETIADHPKSIGRVRGFFGNAGVLVRAYCYIRSYGPEGLKNVSRDAVVNANYVLALVKDTYPVPHGERCMHEFVASARGLAREKGIRAFDIAKRLLDYGYHAPTVYFPLIVPEALMIEPTETESRETLEAFAEVLKSIAHEDPELVKHAPLTTAINRPDEVTAAKQPILRWRRPAVEGGASSANGRSALVPTAGREPALVGG
nr:aminomethyl-transferring glycine dehydrogenase subunit GcvPB [Isosphaera pallida]